MEDPFRVAEIAEPVLAEIREFDRLAPHEFTRGCRHQDLTSVGHTHQAGRAVHPTSVVVAVARFGLARVNSDPHCQRSGLPPLLAAERDLCCDRGIDGIVCRGERGVVPVAGGLHHMPTMALDRLAQDRVVAGEGSLHCVGVLFPEARRALEIGEEERHRPRR